MILNKNYAIDPLLKPANKQPLSDNDKLVGAPRLSLSNLQGTYDTLLLILYNPYQQEKYNKLWSLLSNSKSILYELSTLRNS